MACLLLYNKFFFRIIGPEVSENIEEEKKQEEKECYKTRKTPLPALLYNIRTGKEGGRGKQSHKKILPRKPVPFPGKELAGEDS